MREFLIHKDFWILDLFSSVIFAICMSAFVQIGGDSGELRLERILFAIAIGVFAYLMTFAVALSLRRKVVFIRSWVWMGILGVLVHIVLRHLAHFSSIWANYQRSSPTVFLAAWNAVMGELPLITINWIFWMIFACLFIFLVRFIAYFIAGRHQEERIV